MNLFLNSPSHYTQKFGVIEEVYMMCQYISQNINVRNYTDSLDTIGIVPMIAPPEIINEANWKEIKHINTRFRIASIALYSDYEQFCSADLNDKKIVLENILDSLKVIKSMLRTILNYIRSFRKQKGSGFNLHNEGRIDYEKSNKICL